MIIIILVVLGISLGSFVNALVWRLHEQAEESTKKRPNKKYQTRLSVSKGRSMCPHCKHELATKDLLPIISWLSLGGKCRYCEKSISVQYPLVEAVGALLFVGSYMFWPLAIAGAQVPLFVVWILILTGFMALTIYDLRWFLLPNRIVYPLGLLATVFAVIAVVSSGNIMDAFWNEILAVVVGGGIFYVLFQISKGKWIGGGDVKLGWVLGLIAATPARSTLLIFIAALTGSLVSIPLLASKRMQRDSTIPFGPFLIVAAIVVQLFGHTILHWYEKTLLNGA